MKRWIAVVDPAAEIGRGDADARRRWCEPTSDESEADHQRGARAVDDAREDVAAVGVGAAPVLPRRRLRACRRSRSSSGS